jgi:hypothetical protein
MEISLRELCEAVNGAKTSCSHPQQDQPFKVGEKWFFRTVTNYLIGEVSEVCGGFLRLKQSSWIADTGRFHDCLKTGKFSEVEPSSGDVMLNVNSIVDAYAWGLPLPVEQKG